MRRRSWGLGLVVVLAVGAAVVVPVGVASAGQGAVEGEVTAELETAARCVTLAFSGDLAWTVRRGPLVARYDDVVLTDATTVLDVDESCLGETVGRVEEVKLRLYPSDVPCEGECAEADDFISFSADPDPTAPGVTEGVATVGMLPLPGRRVVGGGPLCLPVHVSAELVWSDPDSGTASDGVGGVVEVCTT
ncbi:hypothetical protein [Cellulomonas oligotrophica]|uniref:Uncharacterized protein n=1 Tax=Cellulomonas oligotrophica TaxID=931536 RepID=A0A7Y9FDT2_9CELL|nr:hypothetical protein [Cellulomonas oligotrophica]NYD85380.1 hypothetical protein [Cellulomonas oligotrophica]GIG33185.1 hypothetical protein Col01nite_23440 [Cellulomonas oligotrophica]